MKRHKKSSRGLLTVVLNNNGSFLSKVSWIRAYHLIQLQRVTPIEYHEKRIRATNSELLVPSVVALNRYIPYDYNQPAPYSRNNVYLRDQFTCQYCGLVFPYSKLTLDHVFPRSRGGKLTWENSVTCCSKCNLEKENRTPVEAKMQLLNAPYHPSLKKIRNLEQKFKENLERVV